MKLCLLSPIIRSDFLEPLKYFKQFKIYNIYKEDIYKDIEKLSKYHNLYKSKNIFSHLKILNKIRPDIIQGSEPFWFPKAFDMCLAAYIYSKRNKIPYYFPALENIKIEKKYGYILGNILKKIFYRYINDAIIIFAQSNKAQEIIIEILENKEKVKKEMYGTWGVEVEKDLEFNNNIFEGEKVFLFLGRICESKGIFDLIEAFNRLEEQDIRLEICGRIFEKEDNFFQEINRNPRIEYCGNLTLSDLKEKIKSCYAVVSPSKSTKTWEEQVGMSNILASSYGKPVISTDTGSIKEFIIHNETGILIKESNISQLTQAMKLLLKNKELYIKLSNNAYNYSLINFDIKKNIEKVENILLRLINQKNEKENNT